MRFTALPEVSGKSGRTLAAAGAFLATALASSSVCAASDAAIDGARLSFFWVLPFAGILGSLAILPALAPHFWHRNYGKVALFWGLAFLVPFAGVFGAGAAFHEFVHVLVLEYIPFIALIGALFVIAGGIHIGGDLRGSPALNSAIMLGGMILASFAGTTGAAMILIRPIIRANKDREYKAHVVIFFIFLVCNIGGALTPLGDPPLFLGYLQGVNFFWPLKALWPQTLAGGWDCAGIVFCPRFLLLCEGTPGEEAPCKEAPCKSQAPFVSGLVNVPLLMLLVVAVMLSGSNGFGKVEIFGTAVSRVSLARDLVLILLAAASLWLTPHACRKSNAVHLGARA